MQHMKGLALNEPDYTLTIPINPVPASRIRVTRWGSYHKEPYKSFLEEAPLIVREAWGTDPPLDEWLQVTVMIARERPKKPANPYPAPDWDNFGKAVCDAMEGIVYVNDKQIVDGRCIKMYAQPDEEGYIIVEINAV